MHRLAAKKVMLFPGEGRGKFGPFGYFRGSVPCGSAGAVMIRDGGVPHVVGNPGRNPAASGLKWRRICSKTWNGF
jgi:hypothetical protein